METGSELSIYTNLFGWFIFNQFVVLIDLAKLWLIPFIYYIYKNSLGLVGDGSYKDSAVLSQQRMQFDILMGFLLLWLTLYPMVSMSKSDFASTPEEGYEAVMTGAPSTIKVPLLWYGVAKMSNGFNGFIEKLLPTADHMRALAVQINKLKINDSDVAAEYNDFRFSCHAAASSLYVALQSGRYKDSQIAKQSKAAFDESGMPLGYPGNRAYTDVVYNIGTSIPICPRVSMDIVGDALARQQEVNARNSLCMPPMGSSKYPKTTKYNSCNEWWGTPGSDGLSTRIMESNGVTEGGSLFSQVMTFFSDDERRATTDDLINRSIEATSPDTLAINPGNGVMDSVGNSVLALGINVGNLFQDFINKALVNGLPMLQAFILMIMSALLPIIILIGGFRLETTVSLLFFYFSVYMWTGIWHIAKWFDNVMITTLFDRQGFIGNSHSLGYALVGTVAIIGYFVAIFVFTKMMIVAGSEAGRAAGDMMGGGHVSSAATGTAHGVNKGIAAGKAVKRAFKK